jgi:hypothetical protein
LDETKTVQTGVEEVAPEKWQELTPESANETRLKALQSWAESSQPRITFNFAGGDASTVKLALDEFERLAVEYPHVAEGMTELSTRWPVESGDYARTATDGRTILLNPSWFGDPDNLKKALENAIARRGGPPEMAQIPAVMTHEFAHARFFQAPKSAQDKFRLWLRDNPAPTVLGKDALLDPDEAWAEGTTYLRHVRVPKRTVAGEPEWRAWLRNFSSAAGDWGI